ncbi:MAG: hypothetical protein ABJA79_09880 [Parafilimonas sp.]
MQHYHFHQKLIKNFTLILFFSTAFSLYSIAGGDTYEIYLNKKLVFAYPSENKFSSEAKTLSLDKSNYNDELAIYYRHCGTTGKGRSIVIKDRQNRILKEWKFADANASMITKVKDILALKSKDANSKLNLWYISAKQLPEGRMLTSINLNEKKLAQHSIENGKAWTICAEGVLGLIAVSSIFLRNKMS